jgi:N-acyl-D-amino-acid deacylase
VVEAVAEALQIGLAAGLPVQISHHKIMGKDNWPKVSDTLALIDAALDAGQDVALDQYPYTAGSTGLAVVLPRWALEGGVAAMQARLSHPEERARIRETIAAQGPADLLRGLRVFEPDTIVIAETPPGPFAKYVGWKLSDVAIDRRQAAVDTALDMLHAAGGDVLTIVHGQSEENLRRIMRHPETAIASDGWTLSPEAGGRPHPRSYGTFARVLGEYVREEHVLDLPEAIRKMTSLPARRLGLSDRGLLKPGYAADLVLFDPNRVIDNATFDTPHRFSAGVELVVVNGKVVIDGGEDTGAVAGRVLRHRKGGAA